MARFTAALLLAFFAKHLMITAILVAGKGFFRFEIVREQRNGMPGKGNRIDVYA